MLISYLTEKRERINFRHRLFYDNLMSNIFSVRALAFSLLLFFILVSCSKKVNPPANMPDNPEFKTYLALGDSYTIGEGVAINERFPHQLVAALKKENLLVNEPRYVATTGWTTAELQAAIGQQNISGTYDIVSLLIGVNDQYRGLDTAGYRIRFTQLLQQALGFAGNRTNRVFVLSIPDYSATPFVPADRKEKVSREIDAFNRINKEITIKAGISYTDITPSTREAAQDGSLLTTDRLHYSGKEHARWVALLAPEVRKSF